MGTRARVAIRNDDGTYLSIYTHWDGYPSHHGPILKEGYPTKDKVMALMALGDLSSLGRQLGDKHGFDERVDDACTAYGRDRGETGVDAQVSQDLGDLSKLTQDCGGEWLYIFTPAGWQCAEGGVAFFGMPASKAPEGLESIDYWLQRDARSAA